jgi:hypothetical protein
MFIEQMNFEGGEGRCTEISPIQPFLQTFMVLKKGKQKGSKFTTIVTLYIYFLSYWMSYLILLLHVPISSHKFPTNLYYKMFPSV